MIHPNDFQEGRLLDPKHCFHEAWRRVRLQHACKDFPPHPTYLRPDLWMQHWTAARKALAARLRLYPQPVHSQAYYRKLLQILPPHLSFAEFASRALRMLHCRTVAIQLRLDHPIARRAFPKPPHLSHREWIRLLDA